MTPIRERTARAGSGSCHKPGLGWRLKLCATAVSLGVLGACGGGGGGGGGGGANDVPVTPSSLPSLSLFVGSVGGAGNADGPVAYASFFYPVTAVADAQGNVYVADAAARMIRKIKPDGTVSTLAGSGNSGVQDGPGVQAQFMYPQGLALDNAGNVYVADTGAHLIRKITPDGVVSTWAGTGVAGLANGAAAQAQFNFPIGLVFDTSGNLLVADEDNHVIRKITPAGFVSTWVGGTAGRLDGTGAAARLTHPNALARDGVGNVYVTDCGNDDLRVISTAGVVTTVAGTGKRGAANGAALSASFSCPSGVAADDSGRVYVADSGNHQVRLVYNGQVSTWVGSATPGDDDGPASLSRFREPYSLAWLDGQLMVADAGNSLIRLVSAGGVTRTLAGIRAAAIGASDGVGSAATFNGLSSLATDGQGNLYAADANNCLIRKISAAGKVITWVGSAGSCGYINGIGAAARIGFVSGLAVDSQSNLFIADASNHVIRKVTPVGEVSTFVGSGSSTVKDGQGAAASFGTLTGLGIDASDNLYVSDAAYHVIRKVTPAGLVSTLAGTAGQTGAVDELGAAARFNGPNGLAVDAQGRVYVADTNNHLIRRIAPDGRVSTVAGSKVSGSADGLGTAATFHWPYVLALDAAGNVLVTSQGDYLVRKVSLTGEVTTLLGTRGRWGFVPGALPAVIRSSRGMVVSGSTLFISQSTGVAKVSPLP